MSLANNTIGATVLLNAVSVTGPGPATRVEALHKSFQVIITGTATAAVQVSNDGVNWEELFESTASEGVDYMGAWAMYRATVKSRSSGTITVILKAAHGPN